MATVSSSVRQNTGPLAMPPDADNPSRVLTIATIA